jgi:hypothetical protein
MSALCVCLMLACENKLAARAHRDSCQSQSVLARLEQPFCSPHLNFCHRLSEVVFVISIDDCKQKVSLDVLLAIISQIREKTQNLPVTLTLVKNTFDSQIWAHWDPNHANLLLEEVLLLAVQNFP